MKQMDIDYYIKLATEFRKALEKVVELRQYGRLTLFARFPTECCRYASDLLAEYLIQHGTSKNRIQLVDGIAEDESTHCWLLIDNDLIVDITADQFNWNPFFEKYQPIPCCYISTRQENYLHECFENATTTYFHNVGIDSYVADIPRKLQIVYDATTRQIIEN